MCSKLKIKKPVVKTTGFSPSPVIAKNNTRDCKVKGRPKAQKLNAWLGISLYEATAKLQSALVWQRRDNTDTRLYLAA